MSADDPLRAALKHAEWLVYFARKSKGTVAEVAARALEQNPYLRDALATDTARPGPCVYCHDTRWTNDENWTPDDPKTWRGERSPGDGLIPCGGCNFAGWDTPVATPSESLAAEAEAERRRTEVGR